MTLLRPSFVMTVPSGPRTIRVGSQVALVERKRDPRRAKVLLELLLVEVATAVDRRKTHVARVLRMELHGFWCEAAAGRAAVGREVPQHRAPGRPPLALVLAPGRP